MARIQLADRVGSALSKMSDGNIGAITVLGRIIKEGGAIDPDDLMGGFGNVLSLDTIGLYGSSIWLLYKDICGEDLRMMVGVLRAWQLGFISDRELRRAVEGARAGLENPPKIDVSALVAKVEEKLPAFQRAGDARRPATEEK